MNVILLLVSAMVAATTVSPAASPLPAAAVQEAAAPDIRLTDDGAVSVSFGRMREGYFYDVLMRNLDTDARKIYRSETAEALFPVEVGGGQVSVSILCGKAGSDKAKIIKTKVFSVD